MADLKTLMEDIARAIRLKTGISNKINAQDFPQKIREIETEKIKKQMDFESSVIIITPKNIYNDVLLNSNNISATAAVEIRVEE